MPTQNSNFQELKVSLRSSYPTNFSLLCSAKQGHYFSWLSAACPDSGAACNYSGCSSHLGRDVWFCGSWAVSSPSGGCVGPQDEIADLGSEMVTTLPRSGRGIADIPAKWLPQVLAQMLWTATTSPSTRQSSINYPPGGADVALSRYSIFPPLVDKRIRGKWLDSKIPFSVNKCLTLSRMAPLR